MKPLTTAFPTKKRTAFFARQRLARMQKPAPTEMIGPISVLERLEKVRKYLAKKSIRKDKAKKVRYACRKSVA